jgi:hypothetical protein
VTRLLMACSLMPAWVSSSLFRLSRSKGVPGIASVARYPMPQRACHGSCGGSALAHLGPPEGKFAAGQVKSFTSSAFTSPTRSRGRAAGTASTGHGGPGGCPAGF